MHTQLAVRIIPARNISGFISWCQTVHPSPRVKYAAFTQANGNL